MFMAKAMFKPKMFIWNSCASALPLAPSLLSSELNTGITASMPPTPSPITTRPIPARC